MAAAIACGVEVDAMESFSLFVDEREESRVKYKANVEKAAEAAAAKAAAEAAAADEVEVTGELTWYERDQKKREEAIELSSDSESE